MYLSVYFYSIIYLFKDIYTKIRNQGRRSNHRSHKKFERTMKKIEKGQLVLNLAGQENGPSVQVVNKCADECTTTLIYNIIIIIISAYTT